MLTRQLPNFITLLRLFLLLPFYVTFYHKQYEFSFACFLLAGFSDGLDGLLARRMHSASKFGAIVDPIADKLFILSAFGIMCYMRQLPLWLLSIVIVKELITVVGVSFVWSQLRDLSFKATTISKCNTALQIGLLTYVLFELAYFTLLPAEAFFYACCLVALTSVLTIFSYINVGLKTVRGDG